jgi:hypothetical protein
MKKPVRKLIAMLLIAVLSTVSCSSYQRIPPPYDDIEVGDKIKVTSMQGDWHEIVVVAKTEDAIEGPDYSYKLSDIQAIERMALNAGKSALLGIPAILATVGIIFAWGLSSLLSGGN